MLILNDLVAEQIAKRVVFLIEAKGSILHIALDLKSFLFTSFLDSLLVRRVLLHFNV